MRKVFRIIFVGIFIISILFAVRYLIIRRFSANTNVLRADYKIVHELFDINQVEFEIVEKYYLKHTFGQGTPKLLYEIKVPSSLDQCVEDFKLDDVVESVDGNTQGVGYFHKSNIRLFLNFNIDEKTKYEDGGYTVVKTYNDVLLFSEIRGHYSTVEALTYIDDRVVMYISIQRSGSDSIDDVLGIFN